MVKGIGGKIAQGIFVLLGPAGRDLQVIPRSFTGHEYLHKSFKQPFAFQILRENTLVGGRIGCPGILGHQGMKIGGAASPVPENKQGRFPEHIFLNNHQWDSLDQYIAAEDLIRLADKQMYESKKILKQA